MKLKTATPAQIDTRIAELHGLINGTQNRLSRITNSVLDRAGLRKYVPATWAAKAHYEVTGTFEEGLEILRTYYAAWDAFIALPEPHDYSQAPKQPQQGGLSTPLDLEAIVRERREVLRDLDALWTEADAAEAEYRRRPWARYFLVTSSPGHIHSSTSCHSCRFTTRYGWMPEKSGQSEAEAIAALGKMAEALCTVCFPSAPVAGKTKITAAKALKASAAAFIAKS